MPEPESKQENDEEAKWSLDNDSPFESHSEFHPSCKQKALFLMFPVGVAYFAGGFFFGIELDMEGTIEYKGRYFLFWTTRSIHFQWKIVGAFGGCRMLYRGAHPAAFGLRLWGYTVGTWIMICNNADVSALQLFAHWNQYHHGSTNFWPVDVYFNLVYFGSVLPVVWGIVCKNRFWSNTAYGVYCCKAFTRGRLFRIIALFELFFVFLDYFFSQFISNPKLLSFGNVLPIIVFAWKRSKYVMVMVVALEDNPFKNKAIFCQSWIAMIAFNHSLMVSMIGVDGWGTLMTFVAIDWVQFCLRVCFLMRFGMKMCPKLISFLITKQLDNIASPLPCHENAVGSKTSMRCMQAFMCLLEGESLSVNFIFMLIFWTESYEILGYNKLIQCVPMKNVLILLLYAVLDAIQDGIASFATHRFCNFSYLLATDNGWHSKKTLPFAIHYYAALGYFFSFQGGNINKKMAGADQGDATTPVTLDKTKTEFSVYHL